MEVGLLTLNFKISSRKLSKFKLKSAFLIKVIGYNIFVEHYHKRDYLTKKILMMELKLSPHMLVLDSVTVTVMDKTVRQPHVILTNGQPPVSLLVLVRIEYISLSAVDISITEERKEMLNS